MMPAYDTHEAAVRSLIEQRLQAVRDKSVDGVTRGLTRSLVTFDVVGPLRRLGADGERERVQEWFALFDGPIGVEVRELTVRATAQTAFAHYLARYSGSQRGQPIDMWVRATVCCEATAGEWQVVHEHSSVPFNPDNGKASLGLRP
jgi:ketosteroid isomerase-like protein